ncbi:hypothetical protein HYALB_00006790 [Hymenoscyphus albidus]|uniref:Uncharacterized protein n=1 Tax=Hymenoscyphus albidus TaxID=595503 RepID=A0A9N9PUI6_9HELO|nr:hypothetical protein HYALB_00006790 [Hymenoscyphus albidus]
MMAGMNGYTVTPHHRQNRRRERPGSRTRRTVTRKANIQAEFTEGYLDAYDSSVSLPSDRARPSPLLRESVHLSWQRWKEREAEEKEKALADVARMQELEREQQRLYGGDISDDELYRLGILYEDNTREDVGACYVPVQHDPPPYTLRYRRPRRAYARRAHASRRRPTWISLPLRLSLSHLRDDVDISTLISHSATTTNTPTKPPSIQHRPLPTPHATPLEISQSLPSSTSPILIPPTPEEVIDWEFINIHKTTTNTATQPTTPFSEPETWILLGDDS